MSPNVSVVCTSRTPGDIPKPAQLDTVPPSEANAHFFPVPSTKYVLEEPDSTVSRHGGAPPGPAQADTWMETPQDALAKAYRSQWLPRQAPQPGSPGRQAAGRLRRPEVRRMNR